MKHHNVRNRLIENTIKVIATEGLDKTTTKSIVLGTDLNEAYIYRFFSSKEELLKATVAFLDAELLQKSMQHIEVMYNQSLEYEMICRFFFSSMWNFFLNKREKCLSYIRYYYSPYYNRYSADEHKERFLPLVAKFSDAFKTESNVWMILNHILNVMLDFAVKVFDGAVSNSEDTAEHVFRLVYFSIMQYFKTSKEIVKSYAKSS